MQQGLLQMQRASVLFVAIIVVTMSLTAWYQFSSPVASATPISSASRNTIPAGLRGARTCPAHPFIVSLRSIQGFLTAMKLTNQSMGEPALFDLVLRPASIGHLDLTYRLYAPQFDVPHTMEGQIKLLYIGPNRSAWEMFNMPFFTKHVWGFNGSSRFTFLDAQSVGIGIGATSVTPTDLYSVDVTYTISASSSATRGTYILLLPGMECPGQLITIGDTPYSGQ